VTAMGAPTAYPVGGNAVGQGRRIAGVIPVAPTAFLDDGALDLAGQRRIVDFLVEARADAVCILANWSEQFALADAERDAVADAVLEHAADRIPVVVTTSHFATRVARERARRAQAAGAAAVMVMAPYHGATIRSGEEATYRFFADVAESIDIPIVVQDAPMAGIVLSAPLLVRMARGIPNVRYFKLENADAADKTRALLAEAGDAIDGPWDGEESITLIADLQAGATGTMPGAVVPEVLGDVMRRWSAGDEPGATSLYEQWLPLLNWENKHGGLQTAKVLMHEGGLIASEAVRAPLAPMSAPLRAGLLALARRLDPLILRSAAGLEGRVSGQGRMKVAAGARAPGTWEET
jgi:2-keto-3-deoxy-L-arabinonate dehydratase